MKNWLIANEDQAVLNKHNKKGRRKHQYLHWFLVFCIPSSKHLIVKFSLYQMTYFEGWHSSDLASWRTRNMVTFSVTSSVLTSSNTQTSLSSKLFSHTNSDQPWPNLALPFWEMHRTRHCLPLGPVSVTSPLIPFRYVLAKMLGICCTSKKELYKRDWNIRI